MAVLPVLHSTIYHRFRSLSFSCIYLFSLLFAFAEMLSLLSFLLYKFDIDLLESIVECNMLMS